MNLKKISIQILFISALVTITTTCSTRVKVQRITLERDTPKYLKIEFEYTHGNPNLYLTKDNKIFNKEKMVLFNMRLSDGQICYYRAHRKAHLQGNAYDFMPRPKAVRPGHPNAIAIGKKRPC